MRKENAGAPAGRGHRRTGKADNMEKAEGASAVSGTLEATAASSNERFFRLARRLREERERAL